jgi:hypothetical protein
METRMNVAPKATLDDDFVPRNNNEMVRYFTETVNRLVMRYNRVAVNYEDITQHVWMQLFAVDILSKYQKSGKDSLPKTMTAQEACEFLGVTWGQFRTMMWYGQPAAEKSHPNHFRRHFNIITPKPVEGTWCSKKAVFYTEDIARLHELGYFKKRSNWEVPIPVTRTRSKFKIYLSTAVHNIFANWCRTRHRKYKEAYLAPAEDGTPWEMQIADETHNATSLDVRIAITQALGDVFSQEPDRVDDVLAYLNKGYTLVEIAKELKLNTRTVEKVRVAVLDNGAVEAGRAVAWMMS